MRNVITSTDILCTNYNVFNNPYMFLHAILVFANSVKMIKVERNMSGLCQIVCKNIILRLVHLLFCIVQIVLKLLVPQRKVGVEDLKGILLNYIYTENGCLVASGAW